MALLSIDPTTAIPDPDLLEQDLHTSSDPLTALGELQRVEACQAADDADLLEQLAALPVDDEEAYPNTRAWDGFDA